MLEVIKQFFHVPAHKEFLHVPAHKEEEWARNASHVVAGPRGRKIFFLKDGFKDGNERTVGITSFSTGNVYIAGGLSPRELHVAVRHETFHARLTPRSRPLRYAHYVLRNKSPIYMYLQEAGAQAYGTRSLWKGIKFPIEYEYVKPSWLVTEIAILGEVGMVAYGELTDHSA